MPRINCQICKEIFYAKPSHIEKGWGKYCSKICQYNGQRNGQSYACFLCNKPVYRTPKDLANSKSQKFFCNKSCQTSWRNSKIYVGKNHSNWTTGESSYRDRLIRSNKEKICCKCKTEDIRILAVHHKDRDRSNNDLNNLIWLCHNCHYLVHHFKHEAGGFLDTKSVISVKLAA